MSVPTMPQKATSSASGMLSAVMSAARVCPRNRNRTIDTSSMPTSEVLEHGVRRQLHQVAAVVVRARCPCPAAGRGSAGCSRGACGCPSSVGASRRRSASARRPARCPARRRGPRCRGAARTRRRRWRCPCTRVGTPCCSAMTTFSMSCTSRSRPMPRTVYACSPMTRRCPPTFVFAACIGADELRQLDALAAQAVGVDLDVVLLASRRRS